MPPLSKLSVRFLFLRNGAPYFVRNVPSDLRYYVQGRAEPHPRAGAGLRKSLEWIETLDPFGARRSHRGNKRRAPNDPVRARCRRNGVDRDQPQPRGVGGLI